MDTLIKNVEEYTCAICLSIVYLPCTLICNHSFCKSCITGMLDSEIVVKCPYCRQECPRQKISLNKDLEAYILKTFPKQYKDRENVLKGIALQEKDIQKLRILYGNNYVKIPNGRPHRTYPDLKHEHDWTFYLKLEKGNIKTFIYKVEVFLDPTFGDDPIVLRAAPFEVNRVGYGDFRIEFKIHFQKGLKLQPLQLFHDLEFVPQGSHKVQVVNYKTK